MTLQEINNIIIDEYGDKGVLIADDIYPEAEELYLLSPVEFDKRALADFYQKFDYAGIRNALDLARDLEGWKSRMLTASYDDNVAPVELTPSQFNYLDKIGWNTSKLREMGAIKSK